MDKILYWILIIFIVIVLYWIISGFLNVENFEDTGNMLSQELILTKTVKPSLWSQIFICELSNGNYLTTFVSNNVSNQNSAHVYGIIANVNGKIVKDEFQISTIYHPFIGDASYQTGVQAAYSKDKDILFIGWIGVDSGKTNRICYRTFDGLGNPKTNSETVVSYREADLYNSIMAIETIGNGKFVMAYECRSNRWTIEVIGVDTNTGRTTNPTYVRTTWTPSKEYTGGRDAGRFPTIIPISGQNKFVVTRKSYTWNNADNVAITLMSYENDIITSLSATHLVSSSVEHNNISGSYVEDGQNKLLILAWTEVVDKVPKLFVSHVDITDPNTIKMYKQENLFNTIDSSLFIRFGLIGKGMYFLNNMSKDLVLCVLGVKGPSHKDIFKLNKTDIISPEVMNDCKIIGGKFVFSYKTALGVYTSTFDYFALTNAIEAKAIAIAEEEAKARAIAIAEEEAKARAIAIAEEEAKAKAIAEEEAKAKAIAEEAKAKAKAIAEEEAKAIAIAEEEAKAKAIEEAKAKAIAEAKAKAIAEAKAKAEAEAKAKVIAEEEAKAMKKKLYIGGIACCCIICLVIGIIIWIKSSGSSTQSGNNVAGTPETTVMSSVMPTVTSSEIGTLTPTAVPVTIPTGVPITVPTEVQIMPQAMPTGMPITMPMVQSVVR
jgi:hypothetical protein